MVSPSFEKRVEEFVATFKEDHKFVEELENYRKSIIKRIEAEGIPKEETNQALYTKITLGMTKKKLENEGYRVFSASLGGSQYIRDTYIDKLSAQGYNMVIDDADILAGFQTKSPLMIFERSNTLTPGKTRSVSNYERMKAQMRDYRRRL